MHVEVVIFEGWKQVADQLKYSVRQTYRYYKIVADRLALRHYLGPKHRMKMEPDEIERFKALILEESRRTHSYRSATQNFMADYDMICQPKLFD